MATYPLKCQLSSWQKWWPPSLGNGWQEPGEAGATWGANPAQRLARDGQGGERKFVIAAAEISQAAAALRCYYALLVWR